MNSDEGYDPIVLIIDGLTSWAIMKISSPDQPNMFEDKHIFNSLTNVITGYLTLVGS